MLGYLFSHKRIAGFAIDCTVRDSAAIAAEGWPVYTAGVIPKGPGGQQAGEFGVPVRLCGVPVQPEDLILADRDGLTVIPANRLASLAEDRDRFLRRETQRLNQSRNGIL
jgi:4-hydroxy-4-methyl-2-oxoglutarate aldolase